MQHSTTSLQPWNVLWLTKYFIFNRDWSSSSRTKTLGFLKKILCNSHSDNAFRMSRFLRFVLKKNMSNFLCADMGQLTFFAIWNTAISYSLRICSTFWCDREVRQLQTHPRKDAPKSYSCLRKGFQQIWKQMMPFDCLKIRAFFTWV